MTDGLHLKMLDLHYESLEKECTSKEGIPHVKCVMVVYVKTLIDSLMPGCSSVWYECLVWDQEAAGSSPVIRTSDRKHCNSLNDRKH